MNRFQRAVDKSSKRMVEELGYKYSAARREAREIVKAFTRVLGRYPSRDNERKENRVHG